MYDRHRVRWARVASVLADRAREHAPHHRRLQLTRERAETKGRVPMVLGPRQAERGPGRGPARRRTSEWLRAIAKGRKLRRLRWVEFSDEDGLQRVLTRLSR